MQWIKQTPDAYELLAETDAIEESLRHQLNQAEYTLNRLFCYREKVVRLINQGAWDHQQYRLDDLQQKLADIGEELAKIAPIESIIQKLITE